MNKLKYIIVFILLINLFSFDTVAYNSDIEITAKSVEELNNLTKDFVFSQLDSLNDSFSVTIKGKALESYTYSQLLNEKQDIEAPLIDLYMKTSGKDYNALILRQYTVTKTVWNNGINKEAPLKLKITYAIVWGETAAKVAFVDSFVKEKLAELSIESSSNYAKLLAIHHFMVNSYQYDLNKNGTIHETYDLITKKKGVCSAYSGLLHKFLIEAGFEARIILNGANATNSNGINESHAWNLVKIQDNWYHIDATWDDPVNTLGINSPTLNYFLKSDGELEKDHSWERDTYPLATENYNPSLPEKLGIEVFNANKNKDNANTPQNENGFSPVFSNISLTTPNNLINIDFWLYLTGVFAFLYLIYNIVMLFRRRK